MISMHMTDYTCQNVNTEQTVSHNPMLSIWPCISSVTNEQEVIIAMIFSTLFNSLCDQTAKRHFTQNKNAN